LFSFSILVSEFSLPQILDNQSRKLTIINKIRENWKKQFNIVKVDKMLISFHQEDLKIKKIKDQKTSVVATRKKSAKYAKNEVKLLNFNYTTKITSETKKISTV
jgi:hypothetical protein